MQAQPGGLPGSGRNSPQAAAAAAAVAKKRRAAAARPCRNVVQFGVCKSQATCPFNHDIVVPAGVHGGAAAAAAAAAGGNSGGSSSSPSSPGSGGARGAGVSRRNNGRGKPATKPAPHRGGGGRGGMPTAAGGISASAPVFMPGGSLAPSAPSFVPSTPVASMPTTGSDLTPSAQEFVPSFVSRSAAWPAPEGLDHADPEPSPPPLNFMKVDDGSAAAGASRGGSTSPDDFRGAAAAAAVPFAPSGQPTFFLPQPDTEGDDVGGVADPSMYIHDPLVLQAPKRRTWRSLFMPDRLYEYYQLQSALLLDQTDPADAVYKEIPPRFTRVLPLDAESSKGTTGWSGYVTSVFKVTSQEDGFTYALRRVDNVRTSHRTVQTVLNMWKRVNSAGIITMRDAFVHNGAVFFTHDYYPGAHNCRTLFLDNRADFLSETTLWTYAVQLVMAIHAVHSAGLAVRNLTPARVLVTGFNRVRINGVGVLDVLEVDSKSTIEELQTKDVADLGAVLLSLACRLPYSAQNRAKYLEIIAGVGSYSSEFQGLVGRLVSQPVPLRDVLAMMSSRIVREMDSMAGHADALEAVLAKECENGRLLRVLIKLGLINERPEHDGDPAWAETGDRYLLKLFRDFVFHQVNQAGKPVLDMGHIVEALNKLDVGDPENVLLSARDGQTLLVSSYDDIRQYLNIAYDELCNRKTGPAPSALTAARGQAPIAPGATTVPGTAAALNPASRGGGRGRGRGTPLFHAPVSMPPRFGGPVDYMPAPHPGMPVHPAMGAQFMAYPGVGMPPHGVPPPMDPHYGVPYQR